MKLTPEYLVGRRFSFVLTDEAPDFTCIGYDPEQHRVRVHALDGGRWWFQFAYIERALRAGVIEESTGPPFVFERDQYPSPELQRLLRWNEIENPKLLRTLMRRFQQSFKRMKEVQRVVSKSVRPRRSAGPIRETRRRTSDGGRRRTNRQR